MSRTRIRIVGGAPLRPSHLLVLVLLAPITRARLLRLRANSRRRTITAIGAPRWWDLPAPMHSEGIAHVR